MGADVGEIDAVEDGDLLVLYVLLGQSEQRVLMRHKLPRRQTQCKLPI